MKRKFDRRANCMGYAFNIPRWLIAPYYNDYYDDFDEPDGQEYIDLMLTSIETKYNVRLTTKEQMVLGKEYVAFRWDDFRRQQHEVGDFHFMKRHKTGHWTHKRGGLPVEGVSQKFVFSDNWKLGFNNYNSEIYLFEVAG